MIVFPKAKINLGLRITEKREDGFHNIETIFYPIDLCDALEFVALPRHQAKDLLTVTGISLGVSPEENILIKAVTKLREKYSFPWLRIHLHKAIPHGAGLGGGSSDAACLMKSLNRHFTLGIADDILRAMALETGSDCPFFISGQPAYATGQGEKLEPVGNILSGYYLILINPGVGINTGEAYRNCRPGRPGFSLSELVKMNIAEWKGVILNDFEDFAFKKHPVISRAKEALYNSGALFSSMSGSGSSVYGIFSGKPDKLAAGLKRMVIWQGAM
jgi:4-diphosphocytidyl-2-C-methyl-D-erythritol kinase